MPQNDKIQSLYEDVKKDYEVGTLEDFKTYLSDDKKRAAFFKDVVQPNYEVKDISEFESIYDLKKKEQTTPTTSNGLENSSTQELGSSGKTKTVEEFNAKYGTNYTDLKTGQTKVDNAEKGVLVPFSPIKVKQPSGEKDFIAPKVQLPDLTKAPMKRYEKAYDGITGRIDNNTKEFDKVTAEAKKQGKELEGTVNKYNNELKQASTVIQNELKAKYEGLLKAGSISVEDANLKLQEEYKKGYGIAEKQITSKYKPSLDSYTSLLDKRKTLSNSINGDIERAKLLSNSVGIIERNVNAQNVSEYNNLENLTVSGLSMLGSAMSGSLPFFLRFTNNNLAEFAAKNNMPELSKVALEKQTDLEKSELLQKMEAYAKEQAQKGSYYSNKITEKEGTLVDNFSQGNYAQAGKVAGLRFLESIPMMGAAIGMTALTGGTASAIIPGGFMFGSQNYYGEYANRPDMSETDKLNASFVKGSLEMITELSVMPLLSPLKSLIKTGGKEAVREAVEKTLFNSMKEGYGKLVPYFGWVQEGLSEYANEVGSTITDKILDPKFQDKDWGEVIKEANVRGLEAFGPGAFGGVTLTLPVAINNTINKYQNKKMAREFASELEKIEVDIQNPNLTEAQKDILIARKQEIHGKLNEVFDNDKQETAGATTEQISALDDINDQQDEVAVALQDETISDESKVAFEEKAKELAEQEKAVLEEIKANEIVNEEKPNTADNGLSNDVVEPTVKNGQRVTVGNNIGELHSDEGIPYLILDDGSEVEVSNEALKTAKLAEDNRNYRIDKNGFFEVEGETHLNPKVTFNDEGYVTINSDGGKVVKGQLAENIAYELALQKMDSITDEEAEILLGEVTTNEDIQKLITENEKRNEQIKSERAAKETTEESTDNANEQGETEEQLIEKVKRIDDDVQAANELILETLSIPENAVVKFTPKGSKTPLAYTVAKNKKGELDIRLNNTKIKNPKVIEAITKLYNEGKGLREEAAYNEAHNQLEDLKAQIHKENGFDYTPQYKEVKGKEEAINKPKKKERTVLQRNIDRLDVAKLNPLQRVVLALMENLQKASYIEHGKSHSRIEGIEPKKNGKINPDAFKIEDNNIYLNYTREGAAPIDQVVMGVMSELGIEDYDIKKIIDDAMEMIDSKSAFALLREFGGEISNEEIEREAADQAFREEQAEYDAMSNPKDKVERQKIYDKYDKLITPLLEKEKEQKERTRKIELLDTEKKIAQIEKEIRKAPIRGSKGQLSQRQLRTQLNNYKDQLRELKGLQPKKKITDSVLRIAKRNFTNTVKEENLNFDERLILSAIGTIDANDKDIISSDANAQLRKQGALVKKGGLSIDQIVTDFINENDLDPDMAQDFRNTLIDFVNNGDAYAWMNKIKEREAELDPEAVREDELYNYAYEQAIENDLTDEEINEIELELIKYNELTQEEYEKIRNEFSDNGTEEGTTEPKNKANEKREKGAAEIELDKQIEAAKERLAKAKKTFQEKSKEFGGRAMGDLFGKTEKEGLFDIEIETGADTKAIKPYKEAVLVAQKELDELQDPKRRENAVEFDKKQNKLELDKSTDFGKAISASSRFKPYETIIFDKPIIGPNGNKLVSYQWSYEWTMKENSEGELVDKRISDWTQAQTSAETGRDIVHKFTVEKKDGTMTVVSSETIPSLLGYTNEKQMSSLPTLVTAVKTLAKQKMQLAILEAQIAEYNKAKEEVNKMPLPPIKLKKYEEGDKHGGRTVWEMGDQKVWQSDEGAYNPTTGKSEYKRPTEISKERKEVLMDGWKKKRLEELGVKMPYGVEDLKNRITRQEKKVNQITENEFNLEEDAELIELKKQLKAAKLTSDKKVIQEKIDILLEKQPKSKQSRFVPQASEGVKQKQQSIIEKLKQAFPNIEIVQDEEQLNEVLAKSGARQMNNNGVVYGAIYNGKIYLNPTAIRLDTPIHEFGHIWLDIAKNKYAEYYNNLINTIKATPYFEEAKLAYPDLTETQQAEEAVVQAIAEKGIEQLEAQDKKGVLRKVFDTIKAMGKAILKGLGIKNDMNFLKATWQDLVNKAAQDILSGKPITYATSEDIANMDIDAYPISIEGGLLDTSRKGVDRFISKLTGKKFEGLIPYLREMFKVGGNYPEVKKLDQKRIGAISKYMKQIEGTIFEFRGIMKAWSKGKTDAEINKAIQAMQVALTKSVDALAMRNIPQEFIPIIIRMRSNVDGFSQLLLDSGFIDPNTELAASISANLGVYMNRSYAAFVDDKWNEMMFPDNKKRTPIMEKIYKDAYNFIRNQYDNFVEVDGELYTLTTDGNGNITGIVDSMENPVPDPFQMFADPDLLTKIQKAYNNKEKLTVDEINNILKEFARFNKDNQFGKGGKIGKMDLSLFKKRQDIADPLRAFLGEYTEPQAMYINTMTKMAEYIENQKFLADLKKVGEGKIFFDKPVGDYNIEITGQKEYSPLSGLYTSEQINNALKVNNHELLNPDNTLVKIWYGINGFIKFGFTGLSVKSQVRNFGSNIFIGFVNGYYNPYTRVKNDIQNPFKLAWSELNKEGGDELAELAKYGVLESSAIGGELRDIVKLVFKDAYSREFNSPENAFEWFTEKSAEVTSKFLNKAADVYKLGDNVHKIFAYYAELATVKYMFPNKTIEEQKAIAADRFNAVNINYGMVPEVIQYLRKNPIIAAFPTFAAEAVRITYNIPALAMSDIKQGMKSKNQQQISVGVNRLSFFTLGMTAVSLIPYFVGKSVGADDDDEQLIRATSPDYAKNTPKVIVAKKDGTNYEVMDLSWQNPLNMPQIAYTSFKNSNESALKSFTTSTLEVLKPFISSEISTKIIVDVATNDNGSGFKIYNKEDNFWNQTKSISDYIYTQARPGIVKEITNIYKGATDREEFGRKYDLASELKQTATGTKIYNIDAVKKLSSMSYKYQSIFEQDYKLYGSVKSEKSNTPDYTERVEKAYEKANKRYAERQQEVINYIQLLQKKGVPDIEIYEKIKSIGGPYNRNLAKKLIYGQIDQFEK